MRPEQFENGAKPGKGEQSFGGDVNRPDTRVSQRFLTEREELRTRMRQLGTNDPADVLVAVLTPRFALDGQRSLEERRALKERGRAWQGKREELGLSLDQFAQEAGLSPLDLRCIEWGWPVGQSIPAEVADRLEHALEEKEHDRSDA